MILPRVEITVTERDGAGWDVTVQDVGKHTMDAVGVTVDGRVQQVPDSGGVDVAGLLRRLAARTAETDDAIRYGRWLFDRLLAPVWAAISRQPGVELALDLPLDLQHLCWEAMHDGTAPLAGHPDLLVAFTRLVDGPADPPHTLARIPRVLFAVGAKQDDEVIRPAAMVAGLLRAFDSSTVRTATEVSLQQLGEICREFRPDIVHLAAHGGLDEEGRGVVRLAGAAEGVGADRLLPALTSGGPVRAVLLSACHSGLAIAGTAPLAAELVAGGIPVVSAMTGEVSEQACRLYTRRFVHAASGGLPAAKAVAQGRRAALLATPVPGEQLDWAMPALFTARSVGPGFRLIDPDEPRKVLRLAGELGLRKHPVFIGRDDILRLLGGLFDADPDRSLGFIGITREGLLTGLGGTRLLREIGLSLLRAGHVPVFLGPYDDRNAPASLRAVVAEILRRAVKLAVALGISLPGFQLLETGADSDIHTVLRQFRTDSAPLDPDSTKSRLGSDLAALAARMTEAGPPFGSHTHVVVLADSLHHWAGAVEDLIEMFSASGLGTGQHPVPVIATYSLTSVMGPALKTFTEDNVGPGFAFPPLEPLTDAEASVGFQWVLLHQWHPEYRKLYVCPGSGHEDLVRDLRTLRGRPEAVDEQLYMLAQILENRGFLVSADDEGVYRQYESRYP
jgi:hypothetical protein